MKKKRNYFTVLIFAMLLCGCGSTIKETEKNSTGTESPVIEEMTAKENTTEESKEPDSEVVQEVMAEPDYGGRCIAA